MHDVAITQDHREQVDEVVRYTAGESPDGFHLQRLMQLCFALLQCYLGATATAGLDLQRRAGLGELRRSLLDSELEIIVRALQRIFEIVRGGDVADHHDEAARSAHPTRAAG